MKRHSVTKRVSMTLLIAGLSATAKAEPTVYYCEQVQSVQVDKDEGALKNQTALRFLMKIEGRTVTYKGHHWLGDEKVELNGKFDPGTNFFYTTSRAPMAISFFENVHIITAHEVGLSALTFISFCDNF